ncbi:hypothetical protein [Leadbetterella sp. DM7]|uniref:hypothetical protein n=1 Tax=Leadbetterella sp. DM7 TaxID=3235085 RepID=UPI00349E77B0
MKKLEKILRETPLTDRPAADFSSAVMKSVHAEAEKDRLREASFEQLLQHLPADKPSAGFAAQVMKKVSASSEPRPLLGLWGRVAIAAFAVIVWAVGSRFGTPDASFGPVAQKFSSLPSPDIPPVYALTVLGMAVLLLLDYVLRRRKAGEL